MNSSSVLLTIGIPTWNRCEPLAVLLEDILGQIRSTDYSDIVEVFVSDNASTDNTSKVIQKFAKRFKQHNILFRYQKNATNVRCKGNIIEVIKGSSGKYLWLMGDDDIILPGKFAQVFELIQSNDAKNNMFVYTLNSISTSNTLKFYPYLPEGTHIFSVDDPSFKKHITSMGLISNLILPRKYAKQIIEKHKVISDIWPHLNIALFVALEKQVRFCVHNHAITDNNNENLLYEDVDYLKIYVEGYYDLLCILDNHSEHNISHLSTIWFDKKILFRSYISTTFTGDFFSTFKYVWHLNTKIKSFRLLWYSIPFIIPKPIRKFLFYFLCVLTGKRKYYATMKHQYSFVDSSESKRRVTSDDNYYNSSI